MKILLKIFPIIRVIVMITLLAFVFKTTHWSVFIILLLSYFRYEFNNLYYFALMKEMEANEWKRTNR